MLQLIKPCVGGLTLASHSTDKPAFWRSSMYKKLYARAKEVRNARDMHK